MADYIRFTAMCVLLGFMIVAPFTSASPSNLTKDLETFQKVKVILGGNQESLGHISEDILEGKINSKFKYSNSISAEITQKDYDKLIKRNITIRKEQEFNIDLQDSTEIINATLTWATQVGGVNLTGLGQTICIIDTGANYSHPDLTSKNLTSCNIDCVNSDHCFENCSETDLNGHGTHVAGIAVASGEINGVAKGANFIALKVFPGSSSTGATESSISQAIDWCVNNASLFNISVISMSLGTSSLYSDYCDSSYIGTLTDSINEAASRNISVVASSGNDGELTSVSSPACIWNVTAVGNTKKDDTINSLSNRWSLSMLLAPGTNINSTWTSGYMLDTGTSMAAPHVSGTIAIIKQFLKLKNLIRSPKQIEEVLNNTGKRINDTTGLNYTRINLFEAISSLNPILGISITYPQNTTYNSNISMINYTATNGQSCWYSTNLGGLNSTTVNCGVNFSNIISALGSNTWTVYANDTSGNITSSSVSFIRTSNPIVTILYPANSTYTFNTSINLNYSISSENSLSTCWWNLDNGINQTLPGCQNSVFNTSFGSHKLSLYANDTSGNTGTNSIYFSLVESFSGAGGPGGGTGGGGSVQTTPTTPPNNISQNFTTQQVTTSQKNNNLMWGILILIAIFFLLKKK